MTNKRVAALCLLIFFTMAWLPLGQQDFMVMHWMKLGAFIAPILLFAGFNSRVDLLWRHYPLYDFLNDLIARLFGEDKYGILTPSGIFYINAGMVWTAGLSAILASPKHIFPALAMAGIMLVNGVAHILNAVIALEYNSGMATGLILFLPLSLLFYREVLRSGAATRQLVFFGVLWGFLGHVILFAGLFASNVFGLVPEIAYYITLILWGILPSLVFRPHKEEELMA